MLQNDMIRIKKEQEESDGKLVHGRVCIARSNKSCKDVQWTLCFLINIE